MGVGRTGRRSGVIVRCSGNDAYVPCVLGVGVWVAVLQPPPSNYTRHALAALARVVCVPGMPPQLCGRQMPTHTPQV